MPAAIAADHGIVCRLPGQPQSYFGWPTVARLEDGTLLVVSSGLRTHHVCPFGKTVLTVSRDDGRTWSGPRVINDSPLDDRDAGILALGGRKLLVTWFATDTRGEIDAYAKHAWIGAERISAWRRHLDTLPAGPSPHEGSWLLLSEDAGATWSAPIRSPVSSPHGPLLRRDGTLVYLGKPYLKRQELHDAPITAATSADGGRTWRTLGTVPVVPGTAAANYHEPHAIELPGGRLLGMIRIEDHGGVSLQASGLRSFSIVQTVSDDGGRTWSVPQPLGFHGSPPHLLRHSSGTLVLSYGYRTVPFGQRAAISRDDGATWQHDLVIRDDGLDGDLGYPATVELADGSLFTVCYQRAARGEECSLLSTRWRLP